MMFRTLLLGLLLASGGAAWAQARVATYVPEAKAEAKLRSASQYSEAKKGKLLAQLSRDLDASARKSPNNVPTWQMVAWLGYVRQDYPRFQRAQMELAALGAALPSDLWAAAEWAFGREDYVSALEFIRTAAALEGPSSRSALSLRNVYLRLYEGDSALWVAAQHLARNPNDAQAALVYGQTLDELGAGEEAYLAYRSARARFPQQVDVRWQYLNWLARSGRWSAALAEAEGIWSDPDVSERAKVAYPSQLLQLDPRDEWTATLAVRWTEGLLRQDSAHAAFWALRGDVARWLDDLDAAEASWRRCLALPGGAQWPVFQQLMQLDLDRNDAQSLILDAQAAKLAHPEHPFSTLFLGVAQNRSGDHSVAYATLMEGLREFGSDPEVRAQYLLYLGEVAHRLNRSAEFTQHFDEALRLSPQNPTVWNNYAYFLAMQNRELKKAERMAQQAVALADSEYNFWDTLAAVYAAQRKFRQAHEAAQKALALGGRTSPSIVERAGDISLALGRGAEALPLYQHAQALGNGSEALAQKIQKLQKP